MKTVAALALTAALTAVLPVASAEAATPRTYKNCTELNKVYKHGVGKQGAHDKTSGRRVTTFTVNNRVYDLNKKSDRDKDGVACEKR